MSSRMEVLPQTVSVFIEVREATVRLDVCLSDRIEVIWNSLQDKNGAINGWLFFREKILDDKRTLQDYNIQAGSTLHFLPALSI